MVILSSHHATLILLLLGNFLQLSNGLLPAALSVTPSVNWYGSDGDWSAISLRVGSPEQWIDVIPNTASSETWLVDAGGCNGNSLCISSRGGVFNKSSSGTWQELGFYELGLNKVLGNTAFADYGLDSITFGSNGVTLPSSLIGAVNDTGYTWLGSFGLGTVPGSFNGQSPLSALSALVEKQNVITSHSYGYTAGAKYRDKGVPNSLTLGGYDTLRFVQHPITFQLNPSQQPYTAIQSISVKSSTASNNWTTSLQLLNPSDRVSAIIDSSTSFLWLPPSVCDTFASTLGLSYNQTLNLYTYDSNQSQYNTLHQAQLTFTVSLGDHTTSTESVNITLPFDAFDLQLTYPAIPNTTYGSPASTKKYFPLRRATTEAQYRIGRVFLQEAYLITNYERNTFSVHQALYPFNPVSNTSIVAIARDGTSTFSGPSMPRKKLSAGAIAGIAICGVAGLLLLLLTRFCLWRRKQKKQDAREKESPDPEAWSVTRPFRRRGSRPPLVHETTGSTYFATEVGADASHERFELPAPLGPVELESPMSTLQGSGEGSENLSPYEQARRKLDSQRLAEGRATIPGPKMESDVSQVAHYRPSDLPEQNSLLISPLASSQGSILSAGQPSPQTPGFSMQDSLSPPSYQRINPANVVYAGRLPDNVQLPEVVPRLIGRDGRTIHSVFSDSSLTDNVAPEETQNSNGQDSIESEASVSNPHSDVSPLSTQTESGAAEIARQSARHSLRDADPHMRISLNQNGNPTRLDGDDIVHIPQPAERRFSFEADMYSGNTQ